jgi:hypothetical protein
MLSRSKNAVYRCYRRPEPIWVSEFLQATDLDRAPNIQVALEHASVTTLDGDMIRIVTKGRGEANNVSTPGQDFVLVGQAVQRDERGKLVRTPFLCLLWRNAYWAVANRSNGGRARPKYEHDVAGNTIYYVYPIGCRYVPSPHSETS